MLLMALCACGQKDTEDQTPAAPSDTPVPETPISDTEVPGNEPVPLEYKMAILGQSASPSPGPDGFPEYYPAAGDMSNEFFYTITFAVEVPTSKGCRVNRWAIVDNNSGTDLLSDGSSNEFKVLSWDGWMLTDEFASLAEDPKSVDFTSSDCDTVTTFQITSLHPITMNRFAVKAVSAGQETALSFNAQAEDLNTSPAYGRGAYLVAQEGQYYRRVPDAPEAESLVNITNPFSN